MVNEPLFELKDLVKRSNIAVVEVNTFDDDEDAVNLVGEDGGVFFAESFQRSHVIVVEVECFGSSEGDSGLNLEGDSGIDEEVVVGLGEGGDDGSDGSEAR